MEGRRGVALLQLHVGWERHAATPPYGPYKPLVLRLLREALGRTDIVPYVSVVPGGGGAAGAGGSVGGLTVVLAADKEPFRSWGAHLASFGCQVRGVEARCVFLTMLVFMGTGPGDGWVTVDEVVRWLRRGLRRVSQATCVGEGSKGVRWGAFGGVPPALWHGHVFRVRRCIDTPTYLHDVAVRM